MNNDTKAAPSLADEFEELAKAATDGPWTHSDWSKRVCYDRRENGFRVVTDVADTQWTSDADFIAFCGTNRDAILAALRTVEAVRALHVAEPEDGVDLCISCGMLYPCPTVKRLDAALNGVETEALSENIETKMKEYIFWQEPFAYLIDGTTLKQVVRVKAVDAIKLQLMIHPGIYDNEEKALEDFIVVHWAKMGDKDEWD